MKISGGENLSAEQLSFNSSQIRTRRVVECAIWSAEGEICCGLSEQRG